MENKCIENTEDITCKFTKKLHYNIYMNYWYMQICVAKYLKESYIVARCK